MPTDSCPEDPDHEYRIITSETNRHDDGYERGEPKRFDCIHCSATMIITPDPTPGLEWQSHEQWCPNADTELPPGNRRACYDVRR